MSGSDYIRQAVQLIKTQPSPYRAELVVQLEKLERAARMHERCQDITNVTFARAPTLSNGTAESAPPDTMLAALETSG